MTQPGKRFYEFGPFRLDPEERLLLREGVEAELTPKLFDVLLVLLEQRGRTLDKEELIRRVWPDTFIEEGNLARNVSRLRTLLGDSPKDERYIKTVSRRGYRFVAEVRVIDADAAGGELQAVSAAEVAVEASPARRPAQIRLRHAAAGVGLFAAALVVAHVWTSKQRDATPSPVRLRHIAVLPFKPLEVASGDEYLGLGLTDALITRLANFHELVVRPTSTVRQFSTGHPDPVAAGRTLAVEAVLEGSVQHVGERVRVVAQLVRVEDGRHLWTGQFDETFTDLFAVEDKIAERLSEALALRLGADEKRRFGARHTPHPEAYQAYLRGRYLVSKLTREGMQQGIRYLDQAIALDPDFAQAHDGLANYHINAADTLAAPREAFPRARAAAERALALDDSLADAHTTLANIEWQYEWDWQAAERQFKRAIELNPNLALAHGYYAFFLALMGRVDESSAESRRAQILDPLTPEISVIAGLSFYYARRYGEAVERLRAIAELDPGSWLAQVTLGRAYERQGALAEALAAYERARRIDAGVAEVLMDLGRGYAVAGRRSDAERTLEQLRELERRGYAAPFQTAMIYVGLGDHDHAFASLEKAYDARSWYLTWLKVEPALDPLRGDPRYAELMRRVGFTP